MPPSELQFVVMPWLMARSRSSSFTMSLARWANSLMSSS